MGGSVRPELYWKLPRNPSFRRFYGHRGWLYAVAVLKQHRGQGIGRALVHEAERRLAALGCRKINLQIRASNRAVAEFYARLGYSVEDRISMGKRLFA